MVGTVDIPNCNVMLCLGALYVAVDFASALIVVTITRLGFGIVVCNALSVTGVSVL